MKSNIIVWCGLLVLFICNGLAKEETMKKDKRSFKLTVIVLTMNRAHSLSRLLRSISETDFEFDHDYFDMEIHVDKSIGQQYEECVK